MRSLEGQLAIGGRALTVSLEDSWKRRRGKMIIWYGDAEKGRLVGATGKGVPWRVLRRDAMGRWIPGEQGAEGGGPSRCFVVMRLWEKMSKEDFNYDFEEL